jgi:hypothetical protein
MKTRYIILLLFVVVLLAITAWSIPLGTTEEVLPMTLNVTGISPEVRFAVTKEELKKLDFGTTFPGTTVVKAVNITRGNPTPGFYLDIPRVGGSERK